MHAQEEATRRAGHCVRERWTTEACLPSLQTGIVFLPRMIIEGTLLRLMNTTNTAYHELSGDLASALIFIVISIVVLAIANWASKLSD
jgi:hypothetical protein